MAVTRMELTKEMLGVFRKGLSDFIETDDPAARFTRTSGVPVFTLDLQPVLTRRGLESVQKAGLRIFAGIPERDFMAGDLAERDGDLRLVSFSRDRKLIDQFNHLEAIGELDELKGEEQFELRLLRIPAVLVDAFWLVSAAESKEFIVPIRTPDKNIELMRPYSVTEFLERIIPLANKFQEFDRVERGSRGA